MDKLSLLKFIMLSPLELAAGNLSSVNVFQFKFIQNLAESEASIEVNPTGLMIDSANWEGNKVLLS